MIPKHTIDQIFHIVKIEEVVGDFVQLKKRGVNMIGHCPFHDEKTPSFTVSVAKGIYKCFGCGEGGNSVNFVMQHENYSYPEALKYLAKKYNIEVEEREQTPEEVVRQNEREGLFVVTNFANTDFQENLHKTAEGKSIGLSYFKERKVSDEMIEKFQLGYCIDSFDAFTSKALKAEYNLDNLVKSGLTISKGDRHFDRFKGRVMFPIHNLTGKVLGFGGRTLKSDKKMAKYVNSPESDIYSKSKVLYGMYMAKKSIINSDLCYLVEGYTDVISLHQVGIENVVASSGTSLTVEQISLIKRFSSNITMLFDGDSAGIKASFRGIDMILEQGLNVKIVTFPEGEDPDSQAKKLGGDGLREFISSNNKDFVIFKSKLLLEGKENDPVAKATMVKEIANTIAVIPDRLIRDEYVKMCWSLLSIEQESLYSEVAKIRRNKFYSSSQGNRNDHYKEVVDLRPERAPNLTKNTFSTEFQEKDVMRLLVTYGERDIHLIETNEDGEEEEVVHRVADFIISDLQDDGIILRSKVYQIIVQEYERALNEEKDLPDEQFFIQHENNEVASTMVDLLSSPYSLSKNWEEKHQIVVSTEELALKKSVVNSINSLKMKQVEFLITENQDKMKTSTDSANMEELLDTQVLLMKVKKEISVQLSRVIIK